MCFFPDDSTMHSLVTMTRSSLQAAFMLMKFLFENNVKWQTVALCSRPLNCWGPKQKFNCRHPPHKFVVFSPLIICAYIYAFCLTSAFYSCRNGLSCISVIVTFGYCICKAGIILYTTSQHAELQTTNNKT